MKNPRERPGLFHPLPGREQLLWALGVLSAVGLVAHGAHLGRLGFYSDDYVLLEILQGQSGLLGKIKALAAAGFAVRPFALPVILGVHWFGGLDPAVYHVFLLCQGAASCSLFYVFLHRMTGEHGLSLSCAALTLAFPVQSATHLWFSTAMQTTALCLALASLLMHQVWLESRRHGWLAGSMLLFALSLGTYEAFALTPLILGAGIFFLRRDAGGTFGQAASSALKEMAPYGAVLLLALLWQWFGYEAVSGRVSARDMKFRLPVVLRVYRSGLFCLVHESFALARLTLRGSTKDLGLVAAAAGAVAWITRAEASPRALRTAAGIGAAAFIAGYAPYAVAGYRPDAIGVMSRVNGGGALSAGVLATAGISALFIFWKAERHRSLSSALRCALSAALLAACLWSDRFISAGWAEAWSLQNRILDRVSLKLLDLPGPATIVLRNVPQHIRGGTVFSETEGWGFDGALRLRTGRKDLVGKALRKLTPADKVVYVYDYSTDLLQRARVDPL